MSTAKATPMIQQYLSIKEQYPDSILFYRMGDFYEMFFEDAELASKVLEIALTSRNKNDAVPVPMCGIPYRAAQSYLARLITAGYKVAICDQVEDPSEAKGLVRREVVRVVTPGMVVENELLQSDSHNYILAICQKDDAIGLAYMDISTGHFRVTETRLQNKIVDEVLRIYPREVLLPVDLESKSYVTQIRPALEQVAFDFRENELFDFHKGYKRLIDQFQTRSLEGFGCEKLSAGVGAAGALLSYILETQKQTVGHLKRIETYGLEDHLMIDFQSRLNLELEKNLRSGSRQGTLISTLDKTKTAMGSRQLRFWIRYPLISPDQIGQRLDAVEEALIHTVLRQRLRELLGNIYDLERLNSKIVMGQANARDLLILGRSLNLVPELISELAALKSDLFQCDVKLGNISQLVALILSAIRDDASTVVNQGGMIKTGFNHELDEFIQISRDAKSYLSQLESKEKQQTGINSLKVRFNKVFGYYIEVSKSQSEKVPPHYIRKQTLVNAERYITDELKQFETKVLTADEKRCELESAIFHDLQEEVKTNSAELIAIAEFIAVLDCLTAMADLAEQNDYCRPSINTEGVLQIVDGRHPVVEKMISGERFVPNTIHLDCSDQQVLIITGPNMAGKSTVLRQVAISVIMAQMGSFVPAAEANVGIVDRIFTRVGALDNLAAGQSTFMVEMEETANILNNATPQSLVIMDEIGRGTSTYDGLSIAWAVADYLHDLDGLGVKTLFATHYHELTELAEIKQRVKNFNIAVKEWNDQIVFLRKLIPGGTNRSYGIQVARLAGLPESVVSASKKILEQVESSAPGGSRILPQAGTDQNGKKAPVQLDLFASVEDHVVRRLNKIDVNYVTPVEALNLLIELQAMAKESTH